MDRHVTLQDIADQLGLSRSSVSMALKGHSRISAKVRQKVSQTAAALGYVPNPLVTANMANVRRRQSTYSGGLAFLHAYTPTNDWRHSPIYATYQGACTRAKELGYSLECIGLGQQKSPTQSAFRILQARGIHGAVVSPLPDDFSALEWQPDDLAVVAVGYTIKTPKLHRICNHHIQLVELAGKRLIELGYRRIGFVLSQRIDTRCDQLWSAGIFRLQREVPAPHRIPLFFHDTNFGPDPTGPRRGGNAMHMAGAMGSRTAGGRGLP